MCREGDMHKGGERDLSKLVKVEEDMPILEENGEGDVGDAGVETRRCDQGCARGIGLGQRARKEIDKRRHDDGQRHSGDTLVEKAGCTCAEHGGSRIICCRKGERLWISDWDWVRGFVFGQTPTQPRRLLREEDPERPDILN